MDNTIDMRLRNIEATLCAIQATLAVGLYPIAWNAAIGCIQHDVSEKQQDALARAMAVLQQTAEDVYFIDGSGWHESV